MESWMSGHGHGGSVGEHRARGARAPVPYFALTVSDTRTESDDTSGAVIRDVLDAAGHTRTGSTIVKDEPEQIRAAVVEAIDAGAQAVVITGGTGLTTRDSTFEVLTELIERPLPGFGELFRMLSWEEIGPAAMLSRATAGVIQSAIVFALPGSSKGVRLGVERLIAPELGHIADQLGR
jgi:molybdenum cofactor biosynthesis protein B